MVLSICPICFSIPFSRLPSEHLPALPHHPSLSSLLSSSRSCNLCALIATAIKSLLRGTRDPSGAGGFETTLGTLQSGKSVIQHFSMGTNDHDDSIDGDGDEEEMRYSLLRQAEARGLKPWLFGNWWVLDEEDKKDPSKLKLLGLGVRLGRGPEVERGEGNDEKTVSYRGTYLRIRVDDGTPLNSLIPGRLRTIHSGSSLALSRIARWLQSCNHTHTCIPPHPPTLPTRVLDLGPPGGNHPITIFEAPAGARAHYTALSHCWGGSGAHSKFTTTTSNLADRKNGIPPSALPKTFQDAIIITRFLGVRYLWIDSVCILQDFHPDWVHESARMSAVYANSYLTISASASRGVESGVFVDAKALGVSHQGIEAFALRREGGGNTSAFVFQNERGGNEYLHQKPVAILDLEEAGGMLHVSLEWLPSSLTNDPRVYLVGEFGEYVDPIGFQNLSTRGWTLQERILSSRVLHYATDQMYWECHSCFHGEDGVRISPSRSDIAVIATAEKLPPQLCGVPQSGGLSLIEGYPVTDTETYGRWAGGWLKHIENYSHRGLTVPSDKLTALAGLARMVASKTGDRYFAGIWASHILEDICWRTHTHEETLRLGSPQTGGFEYTTGKRVGPDITRPTPYRAPSWSWASVDGRIRFVPVDFQRVRALIRACWTEPPFQGKGDPFGSVEGGGLELKAPFFEIKPAPPSYSPDPKLPLNPAKPLVAIAHPTGISYGNAFFDLASPPQYPCYALFLDSAQALILRRRTHTTPLPSGTGSSFDPKTAPNAALDAMMENPHAALEAMKTKKSRSGLSRLFRGSSKEKGKDKAKEKPVGKARELMEFDRVGVATFIRTDKQRAGLGASGAHAKPYGPVAQEDMEHSVAVLIF